MSMEPVLWAFYEDRIPMEELLPSVCLEGLSPREPSDPDATLTGRVDVPAGGDTYLIDDPRALPEPVESAETVRIGGGGAATFDDITVRPEYDGLTVDPQVSVGAAETIGVPIARVSLQDNRLLDDQGGRESYETTEQVVRFAAALFEESEPEFLFVSPHGPLEPDLLPEAGDYGSFVLDGLHWLYIVSADTAAHLGREQLLSAPVYETRALENGGIMLRMYETMVTEDVGPAARDRLREHVSRG